MVSMGLVCARRRDVVPLHLYWLVVATRAVGETYHRIDHRDTLLA
jgi:hypothetical protein